MHSIAKILYYSPYYTACTHKHSVSRMHTLLLGIFCCHKYSHTSHTVWLLWFLLLISFQCLRNCFACIHTYSQAQIHTNSCYCCVEHFTTHFHSRGIKKCSTRFYDQYVCLCCVCLRSYVCNFLFLLLCLCFHVFAYVSCVFRARNTLSWCVVHTGYMFYCLHACACVTLWQFSTFYVLKCYAAEELLQSASHFLVVLIIRVVFLRASFPYALSSFQQAHSYASIKSDQKHCDWFIVDHILFPLLLLLAIICSASDFPKTNEIIKQD